MEIKILADDVKQAVLEYVEKKYGVSVELYGNDPDMMLETSEPVYTYQKYKNGRVKKHPEYGYKLVDHNKTTYKTNSTMIEDSDSLSLYLEEIS
jgi:hypothetical protein